MNRQSQPFPIHVLTPRLRAAVEEAIRLIQAPDAMVVSAALAVGALVVQAKFDVMRQLGLICPTSLFLVTIARSGDRKTTVDKLFFKPVRDFETRYNQDLTQPRDDAETRLIGAEDEQTLPLRLIYSDLSPAALLDRLNEQTRSIGLIEDEGGQFFKGGMGDAPALSSKLWSGSDLYKDRKHESIRICSPRGTMSLMLQPGVMAKFMQKNGEEARSVGFFARCMVAYPRSMQGVRLLDGLPKSTQAIESYQARIAELLEEQVAYALPSPKPKERVVLEFSLEAQERWRNAYNAIELQSQPGCVYAQARDHASKLGELIARVAGVLHKIEGYAGTVISLETLESAMKIVAWYSNEFLRLFTPETESENHEKLAAILDHWLLKHVRKYGWSSCGWIDNGYIEHNLILKYGPNALRKAGLLQCALDYLQSIGRLQTQFFPSVNGKSRKCYVGLNPDYYWNRVHGIPSQAYFPALTTNTSVWDEEHHSII